MSGNDDCDDQHEAPHCERAEHEGHASAKPVNEKDQERDNAGDLDDAEEASDENRFVTSTDCGKDLRSVVSKTCVT